jgi:hypothetical protein
MKKRIIFTLLVVLLVITSNGVSAADIKDEPVVNSPKLPPIGG